MKIIKLSKKDYYDLANLLNRVGLVSGNEAQPDLVFVNNITLKRMKNEYAKKLKKQNPYISKRVLNYSVGMEFLNLGPAVLSNKNGGNKIPNGHAIILTPKKEDNKWIHLEDGYL